MPEFPEVYTIVEDLKKILTDSTIDRISIVPDYKVLPNNAEFINNVRKKKIKTVEQVAKNIFIKLNKNVIHIHLGMTGQILVRKDSKPLPYEKVTFKISDSEKDFYLAYISVRKFGKIALLTPQEYQKIKERHGISPISEELTPGKFKKIANSKKTNIKNLLMDQNKLGGLGNIYVTEALFMAKIHPETRTNELNQKSLEKLLKATKRVISEGIDNRGSTLDDQMYVDIYGKKGSQQNNFRVYTRQSCIECGKQISKIKISGRNTYFCSYCQRKD